MRRKLGGGTSNYIYCCCLLLSLSLLLPLRGRGEKETKEEEKLEMKGTHFRMPVIAESMVKYQKKWESATLHSFPRGIGGGSIAPFVFLAAAVVVVFVNN